MDLRVQEQLELWVGQHLELWVQHDLEPALHFAVGWVPPVHLMYHCPVIFSWHVRCCMNTELLLGTARPNCYHVCSGLSTGSVRTELRAYLFSPAAAEPVRPEVLLST